VADFVNYFFLFSHRPAFCDFVGMASSFSRSQDMQLPPGPMFAERPNFAPA
jgi:hypothetical protein